ncbi:hypothetical protein AN416_39055 (plasmid) [Paraburkholderia caribensis]|nr:hypothetical protein AN416_39055 [Paraburkholderia caribensis]
MLWYTVKHSCHTCPTNTLLTGSLYLDTFDSQYVDDRLVGRDRENFPGARKLHIKRRLRALIGRLCTGKVLEMNSFFRPAAASRDSTDRVHKGFRSAQVEMTPFIPVVKSAFQDFFDCVVFQSKEQSTGLLERSRFELISESGVLMGAREVEEFKLLLLCS